MNRRKLLEGGVVGAGLTAGIVPPAAASGTAGASAEPPLPDPETVNHVLASLDRRLAWIDRQELPSGLGAAMPAELPADKRAHVERCQRLFRQSVRTLYVTGRFLDLPDEFKTHPEIQARVLDAQPEMDEAVLGTTQLLESLRPEDHRAIQAALRAHNGVGERLAALIDEPAREDGIPFARRMSLRTTTLQLARRMQAQSPALTIDPYVQRVRKIEARPHSEDEQARLLAARIGEEAFWQHQQRLAGLSARWQQRLAQASPPSTPATPSTPGAPRTAIPSPGRPTPAATPRPQEEGASRGRRVVGTGGRIMGFGAGSVGLGLVFAGLGKLFATEALLAPTLIFGVTVGPILLVVGLLVVIVGGLMMAAA